MDCTTISTTISNLTTSAAAIVASILAVFGVSSWRRELRGRVAFDTGRALARATYKLRDAISGCRSPIIGAHEFPAFYNTATPGSLTPDQTADAWAHVYKARLVPVTDALSELSTQALEAEALWGPLVRERTDALIDCVGELYAAIDAVVEDKRQGGANFAADRNFAVEMRATISASVTNKSNPLSQKIAKAVSGIEEIIKPHLGRG